ncbi:MAG: metal-dependent hydrolase [Gemmataceae bacterium]|nr:metal-dependent hydrolase [Gemmataceae bacterium]
MSSRLRWLGHSCFYLESSGSRILIDPFLTGNPVAPCKASELSADFILVSHGHGDHVGDAIDIAQRCNATVICNYEISAWMEAKGVKAHGMQHGGAFQFPFGKVKLTLAFHGSMLPDGSNGGNPCGFLLCLNEGFTFYDAADTGLFGDMALIGEEGIDLAALPIGDNYTMGPDDAIRAVKLLKPKKVMPIHYNTFALINQDAKGWAARVKKETGVEALVLNPGDWLDLK